MGVTTLMSQIPRRRAALALAKDNNDAPVTDGTTRAMIASDLGTLLSTNQVATRDEIMLTAPEGMFSKAACLELYPKPAIIVAEKLVTAPLCNTQATQIRNINQIVASDRMVEKI